MSTANSKKISLQSVVLDGGAVLIDALPRIPLSRVRVVIAATIAGSRMEIKRDLEKSRKASSTLGQRLLTIDLMSRIALLSLRAEASMEKTINLDRKMFGGIAEAWGTLIKAPLGVRHAMTDNVGGSGDIGDISTGNIHTTSERAAKKTETVA